MESAQDASGSNGPGAPDQLEAKKRNRIRFSCTTCREKKLKCNRASPCDQCEKRDIASTCDYVPYVHGRAEGNGGRPPSAPSARGAGPSRPRQPTSESTLQARLKHLERLVQVLKSQRKDSSSRRGSEAQDVLVDYDDEMEPGPNIGNEACQQFKETAGPIVDDLRYISGANWEAILDDITKLTDDLKTVDDETLDYPGVDFEMPESAQQGPILLLGTFPKTSLQDMLTFLPPRPVTDRLIARFFAGKEPAWLLFHIPVFLKKYEEFWQNPTATSFTYLGLLFVMICHAALFCLRGDEEVPGNLGSPSHVCDVFRIRTAHCLALDDYTKPGNHKVETLLLYFGTEYLRQNDAALGTSVLLSVILRLAMHMGFHRDPKHYKEMSPFEGEMRRRKWTLLTEIDALVSFQFGLPPNTLREYYDTQPPRNLLDEDFDESSTELPPSRPETERTSALYTIIKSRVMGVFSQILRSINSRSTPPYEEVMKLDKRLEDAHNTFPPMLRMRNFSQSIIDPIDLIMQRYWLELLYQKCRSVLHRKYLGVARMDSRYAYSRWACIDAATKTLKCQYDIHMEIQPGGRLSKDRWFVSSLSVHDFLLADMILCLELSYLLKGIEPSPPGVVDAASPSTAETVISKDQLLELLRTSRSIWQTKRKESAEANRAFKILSRMLSLSTGVDYSSSPESSGNVPEPTDVTQPPVFQFTPPPGTASAPPVSRVGFYPATVSNLAPSSGAATPWGSSTGVPTAGGQTNVDWPGLSNFGTPDMASLDNLGGLLDPATMNTDWALWDNQIQNSSADMLQIPWNDFFQGGNTGL
ncbi:Fungal specific transcription factor domain-containing protein [Pleurostoma richardsiae]|uniref:Fungal specific transcription factor domain-containing protein n=1 Tax=Pleurostoma richardsiae TaxID=41990 RepID=A0AA38R4M6_9PEZI|nr:Fungal specific transcription factor domain-containing protein [Pleurostoma richardsiae]